MARNRLVPPQTPEAVDPLVISYLKSEFAKLNSKNTLTIEGMHGGKPWVTDHKHWNFEAAKRATRTVYKQEPDLTREGGSIPVTLTFAESLGVSVLLLPMGRGDDGAQCVFFNSIWHSCFIRARILTVIIFSARRMRSLTGRISLKG